MFPTKTGHTVNVVTIPSSKLAGGLKIIVEHTITPVDEFTSMIATSYEIGWVKGRPTLYKKIQDKVHYHWKKIVVCTQFKKTFTLSIESLVLLLLALNLKGRWNITI